MAANTKTGKKRTVSRRLIRDAPVFEDISKRKHYTQYGDDCTDFAFVLRELKEVPNARFMRRGWNGKGMFIFLVPGSSFKVNRPPLDVIYKKGTVIRYHPHIDMKTADGQIVPWLASQTDLLADDWMRVI